MWLLSGFITGLVLGSFIKAVSDRMISGQGIRGRSYCPNCQTTLRWYDLVPVISYLVLQGKCRYCQKKISIEYLLIELIMGILVALVFVVTLPADLAFLKSFDLQTLSLVLDIIFKTFLVSILAVVFLIDLKSGLIPDKIILPATIVTTCYFLFSFSLKSVIFYQDLVQNPLGKYLLPPYSSYFVDNLQRIWLGLAWNVLAALVMSLIFASLIIITRGRGMGWGDVKYVFLLGVALGFPNIIVAVMLAFLTGAIFSLILIMIRKKHFGQTIPFGPFLSLGAGISLFLGTQIINWYLESFRF